MSKIKIATAQSYVSSSVISNGAEIRKLIRVAHHQGAEIVHFCEGALSGYSKKQVREWEEFDFDGIRKEIVLIKDLCRELDIWAVIGSAHQLSDGNRPHNSLYIISNKGEVVNRYDKRKCSHNELKDWFTPGFDSCQFEISGVLFGCAICIEIQFPEVFIEAEKQGIDCLLFSTYSKEPMFGIQAQGYAATNNYWMSMSVPANESSLQPSQFIAPDGAILERCEPDKCHVIISEIDKESEQWGVPLEYARPWRRIAREGSIYTEQRIEDVRSQIKTII